MHDTFSVQFVILLLFSLKLDQDVHWLHRAREVDGGSSEPYAPASQNDVITVAALDTFRSVVSQLDIEKAILSMSWRLRTVSNVIPSIPIQSIFCFTTGDIRKISSEILAILKTRKDQEAGRSPTERRRQKRTDELPYF